MQGTVGPWPRHISIYERLVPNYRFYDTPDNEDFFKKLSKTTRFAGVIAVGASFVDLMWVSRPSTFGVAASRVIKVSGPLVSMAGVFTGVVYFTANVRNKDDCWNHWWGGVAAGSVFGVTRKTLFTAVLGCFWFGLFAAMRKDCELNGWEIFPTESPYQMNDATSHRNDYSIVKVGHKSWTTDPNDTELHPKAVFRNVIDRG